MAAISTTVQLARADTLVGTPRLQSDTMATRSGTASWREVVANIERVLTHSSSGGSNIQTSQLTDLLRLQVDVSRYQLRVEMLSKVAESALASTR